jgi:hypothetical protein
LLPIHFCLGRRWSVSSGSSRPQSGSDREGWNADPSPWPISRAPRLLMGDGRSLMGSDGPKSFHKYFSGGVQAEFQPRFLRLLRHIPAECVLIPSSASKDEHMERRLGILPHSAHQSTLARQASSSEARTGSPPASSLSSRPCTSSIIHQPHLRFDTEPVSRPAGHEFACAFFAHSDQRDQPSIASENHSDSEPSRSYLTFSDRTRCCLPPSSVTQIPTTSPPLLPQPSVCGQLHTSFTFSSTQSIAAIPAIHGFSHCHKANAM